MTATYGEKLMEYEMNYLRDLQFKQECILIGCIPSASLHTVWCPEGRGSGPMCVRRGRVIHFMFTGVCLSMGVLS